MLMASSDSMKVIDAASCSAVAMVGICCWNGASRADPTCDMLGGIGIPVATPPGATALTRIGGGNDAVDVVLPGDATSYNDDVSLWQRRLQRLEPFGGNVHSDHGSAFTRHSGSGGAADTRSCAGNDHSLARESVGCDLLDPAVLRPRPVHFAVSG